MVLTSMVSQVLISAQHVDDNAIYIQMSDTGLYRSTDDGVTYGVADPLAFPRPQVELLTPLASAVGGTGGPAAVAGIAYASSSTQVPSALLVHPVPHAAAHLALHTPVVGSPDTDLQFLVPPGGPSPDLPIMMAASAPDPARQLSRTVLYRCAATLACAEKLFTFPDYQEYRGATFAADFASSRRMFVWVADSRTARTTAWFSKDGGTTFEHRRSLDKPLVQRLQSTYSNERLAPVDIGIVSDPRRPMRLYLRVSHFLGGVAPEQVWRSDDGGDSWRQMGFGKSIRGKNVGSLPWSGNTAFMNRGKILITPAGGLIVAAAGENASFFCSTDGAATWHTSCR